MGEQQQEDGSVMFVGTTLLGGNQVQLVKAEGMKSAAQMGEGQFAIPSDSYWCSLRQQSNPIVKDPAQATQKAGAFTLSKIQQMSMMQQQQQEQQQAGGKKGKQEKKASFIPLVATIKATQDGSYTLGGKPFEKLAHKYTHFLDAADTEWMLALAGIEPSFTQEKLATILTQYGGRVDIPVVRELTPPRTISVNTKSLEKVANALRRDLVKHAAEIKDPQVADTLLALNFLNPRNVTMFISYLPQLEQSISQLANLLVASRLGERSIDEGACMESVRNLENVVLGLRMIALTRENV
jgi:hypothetical protein